MNAAYPLGVQHPQFLVGQTVYFATYRQITVAETCPDCLGTGTWSVTTPAGETFEQTCATCCSYMGRATISRTVYTPQVRELTVGQVGVEMDFISMRYRYMCVETGIGSGTVYDENKLYRDPETALGVAKMLAQKAQDEYDERHARNEAERKRRPRAKPKAPKR